MGPARPAFQRLACADAHDIHVLVDELHTAPESSGGKKWYVKDNPKATGYTADDLKSMGVSNLAKQMGSYTADIPGTKASKSKLRRLLLSMVRQIEIETRADAPQGAAPSGTGAEPKLGDVPCLFGTLASQRYHWD